MTKSLANQTRVQVINPEDDYAGMVGTVLEVDKVGDADHSTDNPDDDVLVELDEEQRPLLASRNQREILESLGNGDINNVALDKVIFSPDELRVI